MITTNGLNVPEGWGSGPRSRDRVQTVELKPGDTVATSMVMRSKLNDTVYVQSAAPGARGVWRTVDDVTRQPVDRKADRDTLVYFTDGAVAAARQTDWWKKRQP